MKARHHGTSPCTWEAEAGGSELEASVGYRSSSRMARATQKEPVSNRLPIPELINNKMR